MRAIGTVVVTISAIAFAAPASAQSFADFWPHLRKLNPGTEIAVATKGAYESRARFFLGASDSQLVTLNLTDPDLPRAAKNMLLGLATTNTTFLLSAETKGGSVSEDDVRLASDGVFVRNAKVANFTDVVERLSRDEVTLVTRPGGTPLSLGRAFEIGLSGTAVLTYPAVGTDLRATVSLPVSANHSIELFGGPFAGSSNNIDEDIQAFYGIQVRQTLPAKARPGVEPFLSYGAAGFVSRYDKYKCFNNFQTCSEQRATHAYPPLIGLIGGGVQYALSPRLALRIEADGLVAFIIPIGGRVSVGVTVPIGAKYGKRN